VIGALADVAGGILLLLGAGFALAAAVGVLRFPDFYTRMHAASKAGTLAAMLCLLAVGVSAGDIATLARAILGVGFFLLTAPISAHLLARAAYLAGLRPGASTHRDAMNGRTVRAAERSGDSSGDKSPQ
jgi:multicomponent Na+:H+ antiporter subunit G